MRLQSAQGGITPFQGLVGKKQLLGAPFQEAVSFACQQKS